MEISKGRIRIVFVMEAGEQVSLKRLLSAITCFYIVENDFLKFFPDVPV